MKILSRNVSESFVIDNHILVTVKQADAERVTLGIESLRGEFPYREETVTLEPDMPSTPSPQNTVSRSGMGHSCR